MIGFALLAAMVPPAHVSVQTLLPQMWDLSYLTRPPQPAFTMAQASSYDRASNPGPNSNPLANGDAGQFIRQDTIDGRKEDVMADLKGPGTVVRVWSANPHGIIRFYFDGESKPRIEAKMDEWLTGKVKPYTDPFSYMAGPSAGGILVQLLRGPYALLVDAFSFVGSALFLGQMHVDEPPVDDEKRSVLSGARWLVRSKIMRADLAATAKIN